MWSGNKCGGVIYVEINVELSLKKEINVALGNKSSIK